MKILNTCLVSVVAFAPSVGAVAQSTASDSKYCSALSEKYEQYVTESKSRGSQSRPVEVGAAMGKCDSTDAASAIPILEKALKAAKVALPSRS